MPFTYTQLDSSLSLAMINEALLNPTIKSVLTEVAKRLRENILSELQEKETAGAAPNIKSLAMQHSAGDKFLGALLPDHSDETLERTPKGRALLLSTIAKCLDGAKTIHTSHAFLALMKAIDGMAFVYDEFEREKGNSLHVYCKDYIAPTDDEVKIRSRRPDDLLATSYGIGTEIGSDLVSSKVAANSCLSGKARFFILPPENRVRTWFEKLANQDALDKPSLPLIASPSNATAKVFTMSQGMGLFLQGGQFNLDKAQIFANCVMAYLVYSGHHSFLEVAEIWNRQLDFVAIEHPKQLPSGVIPSQPTEKRYIDDVNVPERKLPYALVGNYSSFLHPSYRDNVIKAMESQLADGLNLSFK
ncbi:MAG: hypothetical protein ACOVQX_06285 [Legionella sp.]